MSHRQLALTIAVIWLGGCGTSEVAEMPPAIMEVLKAPADPLTAADLELFLKVVRDLPDGRAPEFTAHADDSNVDMSLPGKTLVEEFRTCFRRLSDSRRQGAAWARSEDWLDVLSRHHMTAAQFAALLGNVSCAITRVRLESRFDVGQLVLQAQAQVDDLVARMDRVDRVPPGQATQELAFERTQAALRLRHAVALLEFAELVKHVPAESQANVRRYNLQLKPLLAASDKQDPFAELQNWSTESSKIQQVGHAAPAKGE